MDVLNGNNLIIDIITGHLWNRIIICKEPLQFYDIWKTKLVRKDKSLYMPLKAPIQSFYIVAQLRKLHEQFSHSSAVILHELFKSTDLKTETPKTLEKLEYIASTCDPC